MDTQYLITDDKLRFFLAGIRPVAFLGPQKKIIPHLGCLLTRLLCYIQRYVSQYMPLDVPCRRTQIRRNLVELFLTVTLRAHSKITSHFGRRCIPSGRVAKTRNIQIFLRFRVLSGGRLNTQNFELIFS
jgi:hypothetical protein